MIANVLIFFVNIIFKVKTLFDCCFFSFDYSIQNMAKHKQNDRIAWLISFELRNIADCYLAAWKRAFWIGFGIMNALSYAKAKPVREVRKKQAIDQDSLYERNHVNAKTSTTFTSVTHFNRPQIINKLKLEPWLKHKALGTYCYWGHRCSSSRYWLEIS